MEGKNKSVCQIWYSLSSYCSGLWYCSGIENMSNSQGMQAVIDPGMFFRFTTVITLVSGTIFLVWLGEQITQRGIGNGISLIISLELLHNYQLL